LTLQQGFSFAIVAAMLGMFLWDRWRFDVVALLALLAAVAAGVVPMNRAFAGFTNPVVIIIASALVLSRAVAVGGIGTWLLRRLEPVMTTPDRKVGMLTLLVTGLSAMVKNVGALAIFMPVAFRLEQQGEGDRRQYLMPMSFGSLAGGMITLIGTSPNLLISSVRQDILGKPFAMFDFTPVGAPLALLAVVFLTFGWRLIPKRERPGGGTQASAPYAAELRIRKGSSLVGKQLRDFEQLAGGEISVAYIIREGGRRYVPARDWTLYAEDILAVEGEVQNLQSLVDEAKLELVGSEEDADGKPGSKAKGKKTRAAASEIGTVEIVVGEDSDLVGGTARGMRLRDRYQINLLAISRRGKRINRRLQLTPFQAGDLLVVEGNVDMIPETMAALGCLALVDRGAQLGSRRAGWPALLILAAAAILAATQLVPVEIAFFGGAVAVVVFQLLPLREAYAAIDWPVVVLLGCLIPVGESVHSTGGSELIAHGLAQISAGLPEIAIVGLLLIIAMLVTPILHHAAAVLVLGPIAASLANQLGFRVDTFLMAVAVGASCDFLTPIGHQCNALVMGPGRYRFGDYWHLGLPLSIAVVLIGVPLITLVWPLH
jgi:di/tricarboxylate transporter